MNKKQLGAFLKVIKDDFEDKNDPWIKDIFDDHNVYTVHTTEL